ncbi:MAG TPA: alpha/beta fold hydrolase [Gemmatimonadaceae bacterium]|nr:alpha/beta fold hydrolase [Gemmatimonadaceae bacterium]
MSARRALLTATAAAVTAAAVTRALTLRRHRGLLAGRPRLGAGGIVEGAEAIELPAPAGAPGDRAVLVLHGFGDTPQSVGYLAGFLQGSGWMVRAPLLPGHGRTLRDFVASGADDWVAHARAELALLRERASHVAIVGQSMGGAIATILAAEEPAPEALVLLAPYLGMPDYLRRLAWTWPLWEPLLPFVASRGEASILDEGERTRSLAYGAVSGRLLRQLLGVVERARVAAPHVTAPTLVVQSRHDNRIPPETARAAFERLGSARKRFVWLDEGGHVLAVDRGRDRLFALVAAWLDGALLPMDARGI